MKITLSKNSINKELKLGDSVPFTEGGMYIGNGIVTEIKDDAYEIKLDNRVTENMKRLDQ